MICLRMLRFARMPIALSAVLALELAFVLDVRGWPARLTTLFLSPPLSAPTTSAATSASSSVARTQARAGRAASVGPASCRGLGALRNHVCRPGPAASELGRPGEAVCRRYQGLVLCANIFWSAP